MFPLPRIDDMCNSLSKYKVFSFLDLESSYHQIPIPESDRPYTAFEANGELYQFTRVPFGVTNGVAVFQRTINDFIKTNDLKDTYAYVDNIMGGGVNQEEHDINLSRLQGAAKRCNFKFNDQKSIFSVSSIDILGYTVSQGSIRPDAECLRPLRELPEPHDTPSLKRAIGLFSYYSQRIHGFFNKIYPWTQSKSFPLRDSARSAFNHSKEELEKAMFYTIDDNVEFVIETDASHHSLAATLSQNGRPVAFFSHSLNPSELKYAAVEKEHMLLLKLVGNGVTFFAICNLKLSLIKDP